MNHLLLQSCNILPGIGDQTVDKLQQLGIHSLYDALFHLPYRYQDKTRITAIQDLSPQHDAVVQGQIIASHWLSKKRRIYHCEIDDGSGVLHLKFFHMPSFLQKKLQLNHTITVFGEVQSKQHSLEMIHPEIESASSLHPTQMAKHYTPIYPSTQGIHQNLWRKLISHIFKNYSQEIKQLEWLPDTKRQQWQLPALHDALYLLHFPSPEFCCDDLLQHQHPAKCRLVLEELVAYFLSTQTLKQHQQNRQATAYFPQPQLEEQLKQALNFQLTPAQIQATQDIQYDLQQHQPMFRLLQGDVGSGKTIVCALAALSVLYAKAQVALMAPTDLLSEQHYLNMSTWLEPLGFHVVRLNRNITAKQKKQILQKITQGQAQMIVGTHALFQAQVTFQNLGLVIIDEQHRFGVVQRLKLLEKAAQNMHPHQLFVTATPIPRTLAMTQFSHFDISIINQMPQGRKTIQTAVMPQDKRDTIIHKLQHILNQQGQIYWICTRIEEDETSEQIATAELNTYLSRMLPNTKIALVHGQLKTQEKDNIMHHFKQGEFDILIATTVIEVGVDVPNANLIIVENAERLGLSQLHQLRGRVGRGQQQAYCIFMYNKPLSENAYQRLHTIRQSTDGFWLAEQDLKIRGSGDLFGTQQTGFTNFKLAQIPEHLSYFKSAQNLAKQLLQHQPCQAQAILQHWYQDNEKYLQA